MNANFPNHRAPTGADAKSSQAPTGHVEAVPSQNAGAVVGEFNDVFGWSFPANCNRETLMVLAGFSRLRGRDDIAQKIERFLEHGSQLFSAEELLPLIWPSEKSRPSVRWLRGQQERRAIPYVRIGGLIWFDVEQVRAAIANRHTIPMRNQT